MNEKVRNTTEVTSSLEESNIKIGAISRLSNITHPTLS
ncbi:hypothetical protein PAUR_a2164 [Pseudoalteromonas aurantia 208]|uniref:Uncharacterized protein n=1 Tax=Pseudoalteromonas aurantia 208 TaxID=1314867 RepID=A0ABR9EDT8_9GAMM|nr:hypothetical protein [Pseudoalteromonas aurantia 208]